jgi:hypothetical protein
MGKGEMGTVRAGKPPSLPRELRTPLVPIHIAISSSPTARSFHMKLYTYISLVERMKMASFICTITSLAQNPLF